MRELFTLGVAFLTGYTASALPFAIGHHGRTGQVLKGYSGRSCRTTPARSEKGCLCRPSEIRVEMSMATADSVPRPYRILTSEMKFPNKVRHVIS